MFIRVRGVRAWFLGVGGFIGIAGALTTYSQMVNEWLPPAVRHYTPLLMLAGFAAALWAVGSAHQPLDGVLYRENIAHRQTIRELESYKPRQLSDAQFSTIATCLKQWPAYREEPHKRRMILIAASAKAHDGLQYAAQISMALEANGKGIYSDGDVDDFVWEFEPKFVAMHDANVTVFGTDTEDHDGRPANEIIVEALRAAGVEVVAEGGASQYGGRVAVIIGRGKKS